jgi:hypothetical protein
MLDFYSRAQGLNTSSKIFVDLEGQHSQPPRSAKVICYSTGIVSKETDNNGCRRRGQESRRGKEEKEEEKQ